jgi:hypothetical protein
MSNLSFHRARTHRRAPLVGLAMLALAAGAVVVPFGVPAASAATPTASVEGIVTAADTGARLEDVEVTLTESSGEQFDTFTDSHGIYLVTVDPGEYTATFVYMGTAGNYASQSWSGKSLGAPADTFRASLNFTASVSAALEPAGTIAGTVTGSDAPGTGLAGAQVDVYAISDGSDTSADVFVTTVTADDNGAYTVPGLDPGDYVLHYSDAAGLTHFDQWSNDKATEATAGKVAVTAGATTTSDATLEFGGSIRGTVVAASDPTRQLDNALVEVFDGNQNFVAKTFTDDNGAYTVGGLASGSYTVHFVAQGSSQNYLAQWYSNADSEATATPVDVVAGSPSEADVSLQDGSAISGTVTDAQSGDTLSDVAVAVYDASGSSVAATHTGDSGRYKVNGLPAGNYRLDFDAKDGTHAAQWYDDKTSLASASPVSASPEAPATADAALALAGPTPTPTTGSITGRVAGAGQVDGAHNIEVDAYSVGGALAASTNTGDNQDGTYTLGALQPGKYTLRFFDTDPSHLYRTQYYSGKTESTATPVVVTSGGTTTANGTLILAGSISGWVNGTAVRNFGLDDVTIDAYNSKGTLAASTVTDGSGNYFLGDLDAGSSYRLEYYESGSDPSALYLSPQHSTVSYIPIWSGGAKTLSSAKSLKATTDGLSGQNVTLTGLFQWKNRPTPTITGPAVVGQVLKANKGTWDGFTEQSPTYSYQWVYGTPASGYSAIKGATSSTHKVTESDAGHALAVVVTPHYSGFQFISEYSKSTPTILTTAKALTKTPVPTISGTETVGSTLTAKAGTWAPSKVTLKYQWLRDGTAIPSATKTTYKLTSADPGTGISVAVTGSKSGYASATTTSLPLAIPLALTDTPTPTVSGVHAVGSVLTVDPGTWTPDGVDLSYQWFRSGTAIPEATETTYPLAAADAGKSVTVKVTGTLTGYTTVTKTSASISVPKVLTKTPVPTVTGTAAVGSTLKASAGTWAPSKVTLKYAWSLDGTPISKATSSSYKLIAADSGHTITVTVTGSKSGYTTVTKTSLGVAVP